jgi:hypothetical protein
MAFRPQHHARRELFARATAAQEAAQALRREARETAARWTEARIAVAAARRRREERVSS